MKAFHAYVFNGVKSVKESINLTTYEWESEDPFITIGTRLKIYPPLLLSKIIPRTKSQNARLVEINDASVLLLAQKRKPIFNNGLSLENSKENFLIAFEVGELGMQGFYTSHYIHNLRNCVLAKDSYDYGENDMYYRQGILVILPADGGGIGGKIKFGSPYNQDILLKTSDGNIEVFIGEYLLG